MELATNGLVLESLPTQSSARLVFDDGIAAGNGTCQAEFTTTYSFDLSPYLPSSGPPSILTLYGTDTTLTIPKE